MIFFVNGSENSDLQVAIKLESPLRLSSRMVEGVFRTGRAVEAAAEVKNATPAGIPPTNGAISGMPVTVFLLYLMLFIHLVMMAIWLVYNMI